MKKSWMTKSGVAAGIAILAATASAQSTPQLGLSVRVGVFLPTTTIGTNLGTTWFAGGLDYKLSSFPVSNVTGAAGVPSYLSLSADYYARDGDYTVPLILNYNVRVKQYTFFVGVGGEDKVAGGGDNVIGLTSQVGVSYSFRSTGLPLFLQAKYFLSSESEFRGVGVYLGAKF